MEDQVSAIKLAPFFDSLALLGTNLSSAKVDEIVEQGYDRIFLCLDNDASYAAIKLQLAWKEWLPQMRVRGLGKDVKNMDEVEFDTFALDLIV